MMMSRLRIERAQDGSPNCATATPSPTVIPPDRKRNRASTTRSPVGGLSRTTVTANTTARSISSVATACTECFVSVAMVYSSNL